MPFKGYVPVSSRPYALPVSVKELERIVHDCQLVQEHYRRLDGEQFLERLEGYLNLFRTMAEHEAEKQ